MTNMKNHHQHIQQKLEERKANNALRELKTNTNLIDFCSNDYLGFASEKSIHQVENELAQFGATGSRLISGNHQITERIEGYLADFYNSEAALIFNSGYNANLGFFSCVPQREDTIIYDELIHASIRDGIRLSNAKSFSFKHNNLEELQNKITKAKGNIYVAVESVYSMDGDAAPLTEIAAICKKQNIALIVDEAHAVGVFGNGKGLCAELNIEKDVFARVVTFGKAYGCHGAAILGSNDLKDYLINFSRPLIYTTALPLQSVLTIKKAHDFLAENLGRVEKLQENITHFKKFTENCQLKTVNSRSGIQCIIIQGNDEVKKLASKIQNQGFDVRPILYPTVPKGQERLRICLHSFNTTQSIRELITHLNPPSREEASPLEGRQRGVINESNNYYNKNLKFLARENRKEMTKAEVKIWNDLLRKKQCFGYRFLRQRPILNYIVDFMCPELKLIIQIDGYSHHFEEVYENDLKRQQEIEALGYTFVRFTDDEVMNNFNNVIRYFESLPLSGDTEG